MPTLVSWGHDNRLTMARVPRERGPRHPRRAAASATARRTRTWRRPPRCSPGLDGIRRKLEPPAPMAGLIYELPEAETAAPLPRTFDAALEALDADDLLMPTRWARSSCATFRTIKGAELDRAKKSVTDWEFREYTHHL